MTHTIMFATGAVLAAAGLRAPDLTPLAEIREAEGAPLTWVADGKALMPIVADRTDLKSKVAADFLRTVVFEMTGVKPAVVEAAEGPAVRIAKPPADGDGSFTVKTSPRGVELSGHGDYAAYDFAERVLGVRVYYDPKKGGRAVVKTSKIAVPPLDYSDRPVYRMRLMHPFNLRWYTAWMAPWKLGDECRVGHLVHAPHKWYCDTNFNYSVTRPEIFELKSNGQRAVSPMLCYGSPRTLETYAERIDEQIAGGRNAGGIVSTQLKTITVSQWDSGLSCVCPDCLRLRDMNAGDSGTYSPVIWGHFATKLSDMAKTRWPGYTISILPYHNTCALPDGLRFTNGNVKAWLVTHPGMAMLKDPDVRAAEEAKIRTWAGATGSKVINWHYLCYPQQFTSAPILFGHAIADHYRGMRDFVDGTYIDSYSEGGGREMSTYYWLRALWNPAIDPEAVYDGFARRMFGAAAAEMRELMRMQEAGWMRKWKVPLCSNKNVFGTSFPRAEVLRMQELAETSRRKVAGDATALARVEFYLAPFRQFFKESEEYASGNAFTPLEMMKAFTQPKVDGVLDDECWAKAKPAFFVEGRDRTLKEPLVKTEIRVVWTAGGGVTFGVKCHEPDMASVRRTAPPLTNNETLEFFFDPSGAAEGNFYQYSVDLSGASRGWRDGRSRWNADGVQSAVHSGPDFWSAEVYVPFEAVKDFPGVQIPTTAAGDRFWIGNVSRMRFGPIAKMDKRDRPKGGFELDRLFTRFNNWNKDPGAFGKLAFRDW
ncbi:MAG: DUF4838 domain-containing protein [Kiritimatiellae bacterium]|nr:DUF4838 domain-containing protein [Kiritimatiellia bacterium]